MMEQNGRHRNGREQSQNAQDRLQAVRTNLPQIFSLVWKASPYGTVAMTLLAILGGLVGPGLAWYQKLLIDRIVSFVGRDVNAWNGLIQVMPQLLGILLLFLLSSVVVQGNLLAEKNLRSRLRLHINSLIIQQALTLDLSYFEDAAYYDRLQNAREESDQRALNIVVQTFRLLQQTITIVTFAALLIRFSPWLIVIMLGATMPSFGMQRRYGQLSFRLLNRTAPERREMKYYEELLTLDQYVKEVKLFDLGPTLFKRYTDNFWGIFREDMRLGWRQSIVSLFWSAAGLIGFFAAMAWIIFRTIEATISFGDGILYLEAFRQTHLLAQTTLMTLIALSENSLFISNIFAFLKLEPRKPSLNGNAFPVPTRMTQGIAFRDVSFRYPGADEWALRHIDLEIKPGEKLAFVGLNGAGKTTIVKLLTGLYPPTKGDILVDGVSISRHESAAWQRKIGVIFQDFVHYQFTAAENIGVGQIDALENRERIIEAAHKGGSHEVIDALPAGYDTRLGRWFDEGHELSIGQWQKVALSRAFMRDAEIIILDEPTSALDAEQEYRIFQLFRELTEDKLAILISHRFSTVRMADRIAVIADGSIVELGSHDELIRLNGTYARLFNLQAKGYQKNQQ